MEMTHERWRYTNLYAQSVFGKEDDVLKDLVRDAEAAGLPNWAVTSEVGRLLTILISLTPGRLALELGTLGGYSAIWIMRGMADDGRLITIEHFDGHADFAEQQFVKAGLDGRVSVRRGLALDLLPSIAQEVGPKSLDVVFIDADKKEYPAYWKAVRPLVAVGGLVLIDNVFGTGLSWIDDPSDPGIAATDVMNRKIAADEEFVATAVAAPSGLLVARRLGS